MSFLMVVYLQNDYMTFEEWGSCGMQVKNSHYLFSNVAGE